MSGLVLPAILTALGLLLAFTSYRAIRSGGARFYALEREAVLRRASFSLFISVLLFIGTIGLLVYERQTEFVVVEGGPGAAMEEGASLTGTPSVQTQPPTPTMTPTVDPAIPTITPTPIICRAVVEGTGVGLTLRDEPDGNEITILPDGTLVNVIVEEEPVLAGSFTWRKIRTVTRDEGWVVENFLAIGECG